MHIIHIAAECYPIAKVGGLGDVVGALPKYLNTIGHKASVIMPYYDTPYVQNAPLSSCANGNVMRNDITHPFEVLQLQKNVLGFKVYLIKVKDLLDRAKVYGYKDDTLRFVVFQRAALQFIQRHKDKPDIIHVHDHHTGLIPFMMSRCFEFKALAQIPTILSIHNAQYQGQFSHEMGGILPRFRESELGLLDWSGMINPLAAAIKCAWRVNTVSPTYMSELQKKANGLETLLAHENAKCIGILNGIDTETWDPETDHFLTHNYKLNTAQAGRAKNKQALCKEFNLNPEKPLFGFIGRLVWEKGADILPEVIDQILAKHDVNIILLGSGQPHVEAQLKALKEKYKGRYNAHIGYVERMSHEVYASADFLLMPSRVEPCGLNQLYAHRYGCMPIVCATGGLADTVTDVAQNGFGIRMEHVAVNQLLIAVGRALESYTNKSQFATLQKEAMQLDRSWQKAANHYLEMYTNVKQ